MSSSRAALGWAVVCCAVVQLGMGLAIVSRWSSVRDPVYHHWLSLLRERLGSAERPVTVVILGSSRTHHGFRAGSLDAPLSRRLGRAVVAFNFGVLGAGPATNLLTLRRLLKDGVRPDLLLVEVLPPCFAGQLPLFEMDESRVPTHFLGPSDLEVVARYGKGQRKHLHRAWYVSLVGAWHYHRTALLAHALPVLLRPEHRGQDYSFVDASGWAPWPDCTAERRRRALGATRKEYARYFEGFRLGAAPCAALRETVELCRAKGIAVALVLMPEGPVFRSWYPPGSWSEVRSFLGGLTYEYGVPVIDARAWVGEEGFIDSHHLYPHGAEAFTLRLGEEAIAPLLLAAFPNPEGRGYVSGRE